MEKAQTQSEHPTFETVLAMFQESKKEDERRKAEFDLEMKRRREEFDLEMKRRREEDELEMKRRQEEFEQRRKDHELEMKRRQEEFEQRTKDHELEMKRRQEEEERRKKEDELAMKRRQEEEERRKKEDELATKRRQEEEEQRKKEDELATKRRQEEEEQRKKEHEQDLKEQKQAFKEINRILDQNAREMGLLSNRFGEMVEHLVAPSIKQKFRALNFNFDHVSKNHEITNNGNRLAEIDLLLENGDTVMAVEVKSKPGQKDVDDHIRRMEILRQKADAKNDKREYQGAIAGAIMSDEVRDYAHKTGFYVIEQTGDTVKINIPKGFKPRVW